jgi:hypothetical protein
MQNLRLGEGKKFFCSFTTKEKGLGTERRLSGLDLTPLIMT